MRDCKYARSLWRNLLNPRYYSQFFSARLRDWFGLNLKRDMSVNKEGNWHLVWGVSIWKLWQWRNGEIFDSEFSRPNDPAITIQQIWRSFTQIHDRLVPTTTYSSPHRTWLPPIPGWVKLNVDGAVTASSGKAGCGGVIRDHNGRWKVGFTHFLGTCSVQEAEEWAIYRGLTLAREYGFSKMVLESDAKNLILMLQRGVDTKACSLMILQVQKLLEQFGEVRVMHISRDQNKIADALAKEGLRRSSVLRSCPPQIRTMVTNECLGCNPLLD